MYYMPFSQKDREPVSMRQDRSKAQKAVQKKNIFIYF